MFFLIHIETFRSDINWKNSQSWWLAEPEVHWKVGTFQLKSIEIIITHKIETHREGQFSERFECARNYLPRYHEWHELGGSRNSYWLWTNAYTRIDIYIKSIFLANGIQRTNETERIDHPAAFCSYFESHFMRFPKRMFKQHYRRQDFGLVLLLLNAVQFQAHTTRNTRSMWTMLTRK